MKQLFTSESVSEGHPDKVADQISDAIVDEFLARDPHSKVACETLVTTGQVIIAGEVNSEAYIDLAGTARNVIDRIGYNRAELGFDAGSCGVLVAVHEQSRDINRGVVRQAPEEQGAGDQGMMFGYAVRETPTLMPMPIYLAQRLSERLTGVRKDGTLAYLRPDGKTQVTVRYEGGMPVEVTTIVVSTQHDDGIEQAAIRRDIIEQVIAPVLDAQGISWKDAEIYVNPTGRFVVGGPMGDTGLTGRKIIVDTYGGMGRHGGGAFSGKDCTKVDRSGAYAARWVAKNVVASGLADECEVQFAYAIGVAKPLSLMVDTRGSEKVPVSVIEAAVREVFDLRPGAISEELDLRRPIFAKTAAYGHFGREDADFTWEATNKVDALRASAARQGYEL